MPEILDRFDDRIAHTLVDRIITAEDVLKGTTRLTTDEKLSINKPVEVVDIPTDEYTGADIATPSVTKMGIVIVLAILGIALFFIFKRKK